MTGARSHRPTGWNDEPASGRRFAGKMRDSSLTVAARVTASFGSRGEGFGRLARSHVGSFAGDALVAVALAGTLFFTPPSTEARQNLALYLLLTLAPFAVLGPILGRLYERFPGAYRSGLVLSSALRAGAALVMIPALDTVMLFPLAFVMLVLSRFHGISRSSVLPTVLERPHELISANAAIARLGVYGAAVAGLVGLAAGWIGGQGLVLVAAAVAFTLSAVAAGRLPPIEVEPLARARPGQHTGLARPIRLIRFATAAVRLLNGYLVVLVAFALRDSDAAALDFGFLVAAAGFGYVVAAMLVPLLDGRIAEEPLVMAALAVEALAAFIAAQAFGLPAAAALAAAAGIAWGTAKFGFDGLLQAAAPIAIRGRAFTNSETMFQIAWVIGALIPIVPGVPTALGLSIAGSAALVIQVVFVASLFPVGTDRGGGGNAAEPEPPDQPGILDVL
jgi:hypothetical protein